MIIGTMESGSIGSGRGGRMREGMVVPAATTPRPSQTNNPPRPPRGGGGGCGRVVDPGEGTGPGEAISK